jgi:hypothetical protein
MIARAAYVSGVPLWKRTVADQLCNRYDRFTCTLESCPLVDEDEREENREPGIGEEFPTAPEDKGPKTT